MNISFTKMHGAGNDFVMIDDREDRLQTDDPMRIAHIACRPDGIGCEGVIIIRRAKGSADFQMRFFNPDGSEAELCGNGARCAAVFAVAIGAVKSRNMRFESMAGEIGAEVLDCGLVKVEMPDPKDMCGDFVNSGVPHKIVVCNDLTRVDVYGEGRRIRCSVEFAPAGTNVDFVKYEPPNRMHIRTYERGVEAESGACGTGAVAAAVIGVAQYGMAFPVSVITASGIELTVDGKRQGDGFSGISLTGPVKTTFSGIISF